MSDYAIVILCAIARDQSDQGVTARQLAETTEIALPTVIKLLKQLKEHQVLLSIQGRNGGYRLARQAAETHLAAIIEAVEGPIALTECISSEGLDCQIHHNCNTRPHWHYINKAFRHALSIVTLNDLIQGTVPVPMSWGGVRTAAL